MRDVWCAAKPKRICAGEHTQRAVVALLSLVAWAGCQASHPLDHADGESTPSDGRASTDAGPDLGACGDPYADSSTPFAPCAVDSDCHNGYLVCAPPSPSTTICRDADAAIDDTCPSPVNLADIPICPQTTQVTFNVCNVRYQRPCQVDTDCGPAGFKCASGACQQQNAVTCTTSSDCPTGWDCYVACGCPGEQKACYPPFALYRCPQCNPPVPGD